uniref:Uncharacterized protein n=1 Tax=Rhizophora mucronata TaxID=61149 RepID=A0A2P2N4L4_RHIMU
MNAYVHVYGYAVCLMICSMFLYDCGILVKASCCSRSPASKCQHRQGQLPKQVGDRRRPRQ